MPALFRLKKPIGPNHVVDPDDTVRTKAALARLGYFEAPEEGITPWPDTPMITAIMDFQQARGLEPDGVINRGGPTEQAIQVQLDAQSDRPTTRRPDVDVSAASPRTRSLLAEDDGPASRRNGLRQRGERDGKGIESPAEIALSSGGGHFGDLPDKGPSRSEAALRWMKDKRDTFRHKGWSDAAANLKHYLSGKGTDKTYTREQARAFRPIREAEADIRRRIEFGTFLGNGQKDSHKPMVQNSCRSSPAKKSKASKTSRSSNTEKPDLHAMRQRWIEISLSPSGKQP